MMKLCFGLCLELGVFFWLFVLIVCLFPKGFCFLRQATLQRGGLASNLRYGYMGRDVDEKMCTGKKKFYLSPFRQEAWVVPRYSGT